MSICTIDPKIRSLDQIRGPKALMVTWVRYNPLNSHDGSLIIAFLILCKIEENYMLLKTRFIGWWRIKKMNAWICSSEVSQTFDSIYYVTGGRTSIYTHPSICISMTWIMTLPTNRCHKSYLFPLKRCKEEKLP